MFLLVNLSSQQFTIQKSLFSLLEAFVLFVCILGVLRGFNSTSHTRAVSDASMFPGFLTPAQIHIFFSKPLASFLTCIRGEWPKIAAMKVWLNWVSNLKPIIGSIFSSQIQHVY